MRSDSLVDEWKGLAVNSEPLVLTQCFSNLSTGLEIEQEFNVCANTFACRHEKTRMIASEH